MSDPVKNKTILLGVTGSIAAYKAADIASKLTQGGALVDVVLTESACKFISPLTFQSVTGRKAYTDEDLWGGEGHVAHINLGRSAELMVIAPVSATTMSRLAHGLGDCLLSVAYLAASCPLLLAPAMDAGMFGHPATQANVEVLKQRGAYFVGPAAGHLASGLVGVGRMSEPAEILGHIRYLLSRNGSLKGKHVVVTAGGTQESIDPVRVITNRSSGKQGYALAQAALEAGAEVTLITTPTNLAVPVGCKVVSVNSAAQMLEAVLTETISADALIMAAAVADFRPARSADQKIKKNSGFSVIELEPTSDILAELAARRQSQVKPAVVIGFAAETQNLLENAMSKLNAKKLDMIVANDITAPDAGFEVDTNRVTFLMRDGTSETLPPMKKTEVAEAIIRRLCAML